MGSIPIIRSMGAIDIEKQMANEFGKAFEEAFQKQVMIGVTKLIYVHIANISPRIVKKMGILDSETITDEQFEYLKWLIDKENKRAAIEMVPVKLRGRS